MAKQLEPKPHDSVISKLTAEQMICREEFRQLCFTLESAQGDNLVQNCRDKFQFAKTYLMYGREVDRIAADVKQSAMQGQYTFFTDRGMPTRAMSPTLVDVMLKDWRGAIASKKANVAETFLRRYGEEIEQFIATSHNASRLIMAACFDETDAVTALAAHSEAEKLRAELAELKALIKDLRARTAK